jgi:hypothetical protein
MRRKNTAGVWPLWANFLVRVEWGLFSSVGEKLCTWAAIGVDMPGYQLIETAGLGAKAIGSVWNRVE